MITKRDNVISVTIIIMIPGLHRIAASLKGKSVRFFHAGNMPDFRLRTSGAKKFKINHPG